MGETIPSLRQEIDELRDRRAGARSELDQAMMALDAARNDSGGRLRGLEPRLHMNEVSAAEAERERREIVAAVEEAEAEVERWQRIHEGLGERLEAVGEVLVEKLKAKPGDAWRAAEQERSDAEQALRRAEQKARAAMDAFHQAVDRADEVWVATRCDPKTIEALQVERRADEDNIREFVRGVLAGDDLDSVPVRLRAKVAERAQRQKEVHEIGRASYATAETPRGDELDV